MAFCTNCGLRIEVTPRQAARIHSGRSRSLCRHCRGRNGGEINPTDADFGFWARRFGVEIPRGQSAREVLVSSSGSWPDDLREIVEALRNG